MVLREGLRTTVFGAGAGLLLSLGLTRFLSQMLFGVSPFDGVTFGVVTLTLAAVALVAAYLPARRATRVEPMAALRDE